MFNCIKYVIDHQPKGRGLNAVAAPLLYYIAIGAAVFGVAWLVVGLL